MTFVDRLSESVLPYVQGLPTYGGAYIDQARDGRLVVHLTEADAGVTARIHALAPDDNLGIEVAIVAHSFRALQEAASQAWDVWPEVSATTILNVGADEKLNVLVVRVAAPEISQARADAKIFEGRLGVPILVLEGSVERALVCNVRYNCHSPMRAGILLQRDFIGSNQFCSMGFHIVVNGDKQFVTAGHCGYLQPTDWYHTGYGQVGTLAASIFESHDRDLMRVKMNDTQASNDIYGGRHVTGARSAVQGEALCASLGRMNTVDCGTVTLVWEEYLIDECGHECPLAGSRFAGVTYFEAGGDSGSPIYSASSVGTGATAVGIVSSEAHFAHIQSGLNVWNATIITD